VLRRLRPRPPSHATVVAYLALAVALGGTSYAATKLAANSVGTKQIKANAVKGPKVKNNSLTGADINESKLGVVPGAANSAQLGGVPASSYAQRSELQPLAQRSELDPLARRTELQPEPVRLVGAADPAGCSQARPGIFCYYTFSGAWGNYENDYAPVGFQKDAGGFVHLQGVASYTGPSFVSGMFILPPGYRPTDGKHEFVVQRCGSSTTFVEVWTNGAVTTGATCESLDGIVFHP
jgi:hypothetical protein